MKLITALLLAISLNANAYCVNPTPVQAAIADTVTTAAVLQTGGIELNPLGFAGSTALKGVLLLGGNNLVEGEARKKVEKLETSIWSLGAVNNFLVLIGIPFTPALIVGLTSSYIIYTSECGE